MKRLYLIVSFLSCYLLHSVASEVDTIQYWIDSTESINTYQITGDVYSSTINISSVDEGMHILSCRVKDRNDNWSVPTSSLFIKDNSVNATTVSLIEYWIDNTSSIYEGTLQNGIFNSSLNLSQLLEGIHFLSYRVKDDTGKWSVPQTSIIIKDAHTLSSTVNKLEYWIDNTSKIHESTLQNGLFSSSLNLSQLTEGIHFLSYRVKDDTGKWSVPQTSIIIKDAHTLSSTVNKLEYWIDNTSNIHEASLQNGIFTSSLDMSKLGNGCHHIHFRVCDENGIWGTPKSISFLKDSDSYVEKKLTEYEYWINGNEDKKKVEKLETSTSVYEGSLSLDLDKSQLKLSDKDVALIPDGYGKYHLGYSNSLSVRFKDDFGRCGIERTDTFAVELKGERPNISAVIKNSIVNEGEAGWKRYSNGEKIPGAYFQNWGLHYLYDESSYLKIGLDVSSWNGGVSQYIQGLPEGNYLLGAKVRGDSNIAATLSVNDISIELPLCGFEGGSIWEEAEEGSEIKNRNNGKGFGWNSVYLPFTTIGNPIEIKVDANTQNSTSKWLYCTDFELYKINSSSLKVSIGSNVDLTTIQEKILKISGDDFNLEIPIGNSREYLINSLLKDSHYVLTLEDKSGLIYWSKEITFSVDNEIIIDTIADVTDVNIIILTPQGNDVTEKVKVKWLNSKGAIISIDSTLENVPEGNTIYYSLELGEDLGKMYLEPSNVALQISAKDSEIIHALSPFEQLVLHGRVVAKSQPISNATISIRQLLNMRYKSETTVLTNPEGEFELSLPADSCWISISAKGYYDKKIEMPSPADLEDIELDRIATRQISLNISVTELSPTSEIKESTSWIGGNDKLNFRVVNYSKNDSEMKVACQYGALYVEEAEDGDLLLIEMSHQDNKYIGSSCLLTFDSSTDMKADLTLTARGAIQASVVESENPVTDYILYDLFGKYVASTSATGTKSAKFDNLESGEYTIVAIGKSLLMGMFANVGDFDNAGLKQGRDYILSKVEVEDALTTIAEMGKVPELDESLFYYTSEQTSFTANKSETIPGNYITYTVKLDFKDEYKEQAKNISLIVDIPEGMEIVSNSAIIGFEPAVYSFDGRRMTIPLTKENYLERIRFCLMPLESGIKNVNTSLKFTTNREVLQPIGRLAAEIKQLDINAPKVTNKAEIVVSGKAMPGSEVIVYDNDQIIGTTTVKSEGTWNAVCQLDPPCIPFCHTLHAEITVGTKEISTNFIKVEYNKCVNHVKTVTMYNTAHPVFSLSPKEYITEFNFINPSDKEDVYWYYPKYPDFTFVIDFQNNSPDFTENVTLNVSTSAGTVERLESSYDSEQDKWIASGKFYTSALPINVSVAYDAINRPPTKDDIILGPNLKTFRKFSNECLKLKSTLVSIENQIDNCLNEERFISLEELKDIYESNGLSFSIFDDGIETEDLLSQDITNAIDQLSLSDTQNEKILLSNFKENYINRCKSLSNNEFSIDSFVEFSDNGRVSFQNEFSIEIVKIDNIENYLDESFIEMTDEDGEIIFCKCTNGKISIIYSDSLELLEYSWITQNVQGESRLGIISSTDLKKQLNEGKNTINKAVAQIKEAFENLKKSKNYVDNLAKAVYKYLEKKFNESPRLIKAVDFLISEVAENEKVIKFLTSFCSKILNVKSVVDEVQNSIKIIDDTENMCNKLLKDIENCYGSQEKHNIQELVEDIKGEVNSSISKKMAVKIGKNTVSLLSKTNPFTFGVSILCEIAFWEFDKTWENLIINGRDNSINSIKDRYRWNDCDDDKKPENQPQNEEPSGEKDKVPFNDPSGYVYEAVTSNRIEGVTATIYEQGVDAPWNASDYLQVNPQVTDESGIYAWDVPIGNWQVRFNKEGYDPVATPWLPVPPPQLDINIPMYHAVNPSVKSAKGNPKYVSTTFDKYMIPASITDSKLTIWRGDDQIDGEIEFANLEEDPNTGLSYVSKVAFHPVTPFNVGEIVQLHIDKDVLSYAEMPMTDNFIGDVKIESEITEFITEGDVKLAPGETINMAVYALPAEASCGKYLSIDNVSSLYSVSDTRVAFDSDGRASFSITGKLSGGAPLYFSIPNTEWEGITMVNIELPDTKVATPKASIPTGTIVAPGTMVTLTCSTPGAEIYYTLNGECPCDNASAIKYTVPIVIDKDMIIKSQAYKERLSDSAVATFIYKIESDESVNTISNGYIVTMEKDNIIISNCDGLMIDIYDANGLTIYNRKDITGTCRIPLQNHGLYFVKISSKDSQFDIIKVMN